MIGVMKKASREAGLFGLVVYSLESELRFQAHGAGTNATVMRIAEVSSGWIGWILHIEHVHVEAIGFIGMVQDIERVGA